VSVIPVSRQDAPVAGARTHRVVALAAGKGGVGTSTTAALLAAVLAANGRRVLLIDAANRLGTLDALLGVTPALPLNALRGGQAEPESLLVPVADGLTLLPAHGSGGDGSLSASERRVLFGRMQSLFPRYDLVLFDAGASAESVLAAAAGGVTRVLAVTAGDRVTITATFALIKLLTERHADVRVDLLANRIPEPIAHLAHDCVNQATVRFLSRTVHLAGVVPDDPHFGTALNAGLGTHVAALGSTAALVMQHLGDRLLGENDPPAHSPAGTRHLRRN
jgi:flagellar biosynthesis protein FlhG